LKNQNERSLNELITRRNAVLRKLEAIEQCNDGEDVKDLVKDLKLEEKEGLKHSLDNLQVHEILGKISFEDLFVGVFGGKEVGAGCLEGGKGGECFQAKIEGLKKLLNAVLGRGRRYCDFLNGSVFGEIELCRCGLEKGQQEY
jgi:hypothetical protein